MDQPRKNAKSPEPRPPFPVQHRDSPGDESELDPWPQYEAAAYKPAGKLEGKVALVTGGDSGIGRAVALMFAREGAAVAINYLAEEQDDAEGTRAAIEEHGGTCLLLPGDLIDRKFCAKLVERTVRKLGALDILVSNAAHQTRKEDLDEFTDEELVFLASNADSSYITGTILQVMGGETSGG